MSSLEVLAKLCRPDGERKGMFRRSSIGLRGLFVLCAESGQMRKAELIPDVRFRPSVSKSLMYPAMSGKMDSRVLLRGECPVDLVFGERCSLDASHVGELIILTDRVRPKVQVSSAVHTRSLTSAPLHTQRSVPRRYH